MDFNILYAIQNMHTPFLDRFFLILTDIAGSYGHLWLIIGALMCIFKKTRKCGIGVLLSYALVYLTGQLILKDIIARPRPCHLDQTVELLVSRPSSYSCPSTHSAWAFAAASVIFMNHRKTGIAALIIAALIAFSRLYLFVHFPTDVLFGIVLGVICAIVSVSVIRLISGKLSRRQQKKVEQ